MGHDFGGEPRLVMRAAGLAWVKTFLWAMLAVEAVLLVTLAASGSMPLLGVLATLLGLSAVILLVWAILPRSFEVYDDRLVIVFPRWRWNIPLDSIELVRDATGFQPYGYWGLRFASAPAKAVELRRRRSNLFRRPNLIISPDDRRLFVTEMTAALARYQHLHGPTPER
jgi:hypothetical protein